MVKSKKYKVDPILTEVQIITRHLWRSSWSDLNEIKADNIDYWNRLFIITVENNLYFPEDHNYITNDM